MSIHTDTKNRAVIHLTILTWIIKLNKLEKYVNDKKVIN